MMTNGWDNAMSHAAGQVNEASGPADHGTRCIRRSGAERPCHAWVRQQLLRVAIACCAAGLAACTASGRAQGGPQTSRSRMHPPRMHAVCVLQPGCTLRPAAQAGVTFKAQEQEASRGSDSLNGQQHDGPRSNGSASARCTVQITVRACRVGCSGVGAEGRRRRMGWATRRTCLPGSPLACATHGQPARACSNSPFAALVRVGRHALTPM